jgi:hypothetical protein
MSTILEISSDAKTLEGQNGATKRISLPEGTEGIIRPTRMPRTMEELIEMVTVQPGETNGMEHVFGKWPGDETDEEIDQALRELS